MTELITKDKLQLTGQNMDRVFNFRNSRVHVVHFLCYGVKQPNLKKKTRPKQHLGSLPFDIALLVITEFTNWGMQK
jgi:hypothetical protein